jgi:hypothetical protein
MKPKANLYAYIIHEKFHKINRLLAGIGQYFNLPGRAILYSQLTNTVLVIYIISTKFGVEVDRM